MLLKQREVNNVKRSKTQYRAPIKEETPKIFEEPISAAVQSEPIPELAPEPTPEPVPEVISEPISEPIPEPNPAPVPEPEPEPEPIPESIKPPAPKTYRVKVNHPRLNRRSIPSLSGVIRGLILDQGVYEIFDTVNGWGKLENGDWIMLQYTTIL